jgi:hypothetical protein
MGCFSRMNFAPSRDARVPHVRPAALRALASAAMVVCLLLTSILPAYAQAGGSSGNVNGTIVSPSGTPVPNAAVRLASPSGSFSQRTNDHGYFSFLGVPTDTYTISVEAPGYNPLTQQGITLAGAQTLTLGAVKLSPITQLIGRVSARSAASAFQPNQTIPQYTVSGAVLQTAAGKASNSNESQILLAVPGFQTDSTGNLILQGATRDQIRYQFDGVDFTDPGFSFSANNSFFNGISSVQVVSGAGDPSQGNGGAGVVNLIVKRGTYPPTGLADFEVNSRPWGQQANLQYGIATANGKVSDFVSYFGDDQGFHYGQWGTNAYALPVNGQIALNSSQETSDFINNFVYRFGNQNNQSLQVLYLAHADTIYGNYAGVPLVYDNGDPAVLSLLSDFSGLSNSQVSHLLSYEQGQTAIGQAVPAAAGIGNSSLLKFEYDNQLNSTTSLALRFFHSDVYDYEEASGNMGGYGLVAPLYGQTSGGSRTGANFDINEQIGENNTVTLSGNYEFNRPNFGTVASIQGFEDMAGNIIDFLRPPNPNAPVSASNPCPVAGGCYLQQFFYTKGGTPTAPNLQLQSGQPNLTFGSGIRDQYQVTKKLRLDLGLRYDIFNQFLSPGYVNSQDENVQPVPGNPSAFAIPDYGFVNQPHYLQPRLGASYLLSPRDTVGLTYGKSINLGGNGLYASPEGYSEFAAYNNIPVNPNWVSGTFYGNPAPYFNSAGVLLCNVNVPYALNATPNSSPDYNGTVAGANPTLEMGKPCGNYGNLLRSQLDAYFPEIVNIQPAVLYNNDVSYAHVFPSGVALKIDGFNRQAYHVQQITAPLIFNPLTNSTSPGSLVGTTNGTNQTTGVDINLTLPEHPFGFTGFISATYVNELTNTPAAADNFAAQDFEPFALPQFSALNNVYRAGFVSPLTVHIGAAYKTRSGWRFNPVLNVNNGFPYNAGTTTPYFLPGFIDVNVPNTNVTDPYVSSTAGNPYYVDPANPGSVFNPNISASRGNKEGYAGSQLSPPLATMDFTLEYTPPRFPRSTFGLQVLDVFNNGYFERAFPNPNFYPVSSGVSGPLTGQNVTGASNPTYASLIGTDTYPYAPYVVTPFLQSAVGTAATPWQDLPLTFRVYYQLKL